MVRVNTCGVISIKYFKSKITLYISFHLIGIIIILLSLFQINEAYAKVEASDEIYATSIVPFYWMIMLIGGIIIITLSYVGWRKYKGDQKKRRKRDTNN